MKTLLYLEDDEVLRRVTCKALKKRNFEVEHCASLAQAQAVLQHGTRFQYALLDLNVEDGNGLSLIDSLLEHNPQLHIVILTGYASIASAVQAIKRGAINYLSKPASIDDILQAFDAQEDEPEAFFDVQEAMSVRRLEWEHIQRVLAENNGNISATARQLKMHRRTLQRKLQKKPVAE